MTVSRLHGGTAAMRYFTFFRGDSTEVEYIYTGRLPRRFPRDAAREKVRDARVQDAENVKAPGSVCTQPKRTLERAPARA